ncbi:hypothetical protein JQ628_04905 [Bradyrhizobium lablabi]|uniref:hypothetical protein n=1 Tax=Bradyrhizobium lablabi TaxID=722472 RepID=UPI001BA7B701|nr:hypothetical protein [Bradyrhizobium lablabi]MBR1120847.1 hypothetical protein [Bradyrhizobium lablabi]
MTRNLGRIAALGALLISSAAYAENPSVATAISPIFGQLVAFSMPMTFVPAFEETKGPSYIREAVLKGETIARWTQMITITGARGAAGNPKATPETVAGFIAAGFKNACPDTFTAQGVGATKFGGHEAYVAIAGCGRVESSADKHSETALIVAIKGSVDYYTMQWAERAGPSGKPAIDAAKWQARLRQLQPIRLCQIVPGETAPYPSCVGRN